MAVKPKVNVKKRNWGIWFIITLVDGILNKEVIREEFQVDDFSLILYGMIGSAILSYLISSLVWAVFLQSREFTKVLIVTAIINAILTYIGLNLAWICLSR